MSRFAWPSPYNPTFEEHQRIIAEMTNTTRDYPPRLFDQKAAEEALKHLPVFVVGYNMPNRSIRVRWSLKSEEDRMPYEVLRDTILGSPRTRPSQNAGCRTRRRQPDNGQSR